MLLAISDIEREVDEAFSFARIERKFMRGRR
jgi:hypothetical protein